LVVHPRIVRRHEHHQLSLKAPTSVGDGTGPKGDIKSSTQVFSGKAFHQFIRGPFDGEAGFTHRRRRKARLVKLVRERRRGERCREPLRRSAGIRFTAQVKQQWLLAGDQETKQPVSPVV